MSSVRRAKLLVFVCALSFALAACKPIKVRNTNKHDPGPPPEVSALADAR